MKNKIGLFIFSCLLSLPVMAQDTNRTKIDEKSQMEVLIGLCNRNGLKSNLFKTYYETEYAAYLPDTATISELKRSLVNKNILTTIVMGSWCGDSQEQVPRFYKIIDAVGYSESNITLYCVDRTKKTDKGETNNLNITLVPTFIFFKDGKEIGRIIESPKQILEKDIAEIISP
jgi:thiol-disulfide isomerase/thioredoxin